MDTKTAQTSNVHALDKINNALRDPTKPWYPLFHWAEERTGLNRLKLFLGVVCALAMYLASGHGPMLLGDLIGFAYPAYATTALMIKHDPWPPAKTAGRGGLRDYGVNDTTKWLTYWLMFASALIVEQPFIALLRLVPFYCLTKTVFFVFCSLSVETNGCALVYAVIVRRYFASPNN